MAPSPTGPLHVGTARTTLFNYLFARHHGGAFILRIEDTDAERNSIEWLRSVLEGIRWLGLDWDEGPDPDSLPPDAAAAGPQYFPVARSLGNRGEYGPYYQSQRGDIYHEFVERLLSEDKAYPCFCTKEELDRSRDEQKSRGIAAPRYDGRCASLSAADCERLRSEGKPFSVRLRVPESGDVGFDDLIRGRIDFDSSAFDDFIIQKSDGSSLYNFSVVIDDVTMEITHVLRGDDHISNTPKQILIYRALVVPPPLFGHLPMINGPDGKKLSKRHGPTELTEYGERGVLPEAMVNFMGLLGWSPGEGETQEIFSLDELIERFDLAHVNKAPAVFNIEKLEWMNAIYLRKLPLDELVDLCLPHLQRAGLVPTALSPEQKEYVKSVLALERERLRYPNEAPEMTRFFFVEEYDMDEKAMSKWLNGSGGKELVRAASERLSMLEKFDHEALESAIRSLAEERGLSAAKIIHPLRVALTGRTVGPGLFELMTVLGKERCLNRINRILAD